jgi:hypothetical protein
MTVSILVMFHALDFFGANVESKETDDVGSGAIETVAVYLLSTSGSLALLSLPDCRLIAKDCERNSSNSGSTNLMVRTAPTGYYL